MAGTAGATGATGATGPSGDPWGGGTFTGRTIHRQSGVALGTGNSSQIEVNNAGSGACNISFHREGAYGAHFGLDTDNWFSTYGWSAGGGYTSMRVGTLVASGNVTAYSDIRIKEDIQVIPNALAKVQSIRGVTFTRNDLEDKELRHAGVIAQEVEIVLPEVILEGRDGIKTVAYGNMVGLLIEAIKELSAKLEVLESR